MGKHPQHHSKGAPDKNDVIRTLQCFSSSVRKRAEDNTKEELDSSSVSPKSYNLNTLNPKPLNPKTLNPKTLNPKYPKSLARDEPGSSRISSRREHIACFLQLGRLDDENDGDNDDNK